MSCRNRELAFFTGSSTAVFSSAGLDSSSTCFFISHLSPTQQCLGYVLILQWHFLPLQKGPLLGSEDFVLVRALIFRPRGAVLSQPNDCQLLHFGFSKRTTYRSSLFLFSRYFFRAGNTFLRLSVGLEVVSSFLEKLGGKTVQE